MKAKELKEKAEINTKDFEPLSNNRKIYGFSKNEFDKFVNQLCKEQRNECAKEYRNNDLRYTYKKELSDRILNAPEPEL